LEGVRDGKPGIRALDAFGGLDLWRKTLNFSTERENEG